MADRLNFNCKVCCKIVNNNNKSILCAGKCKLLYHLQCIPLNKDEKNALASSTKLLWLCESCSTVEPGSLFSVLSELIDTISVLNKEISVLKEIVKCSHKNLKNSEPGADRNCSCQLSRKRKSRSLNHCEEKVAENGKEDSETVNLPMEVDTNPIEIKIECISPEKIEEPTPNSPEIIEEPTAKSPEKIEEPTPKSPDNVELLQTEKDPLQLKETILVEKELVLITQDASSSSEPKLPCSEQDPLLIDPNLIQVSSIKNKQHETITIDEKSPSSSSPKSDSDSAKNPEDAVKSSRRSIRPAYKVQVIKEGSIDEV